MKTDNELIAEFIGYERSREPWENDEHAYTMKLNPVWNKWVIPSNMCFNTSWDWLMPVVEKIESIEGVRFIIERNKVVVLTYAVHPEYFCRKTTETKLTTIYNAVVEFIKWYNSQSPDLIEIKK